MSAERKIDRYLRSEDTLPARVLNRICHLKGIKYRKSTFKKVGEPLLTGMPAAFSTPLTLSLATEAKLEDNGPFFYRQQRLAENGKKISVIKVRTMHPKADILPKADLETTARLEPEEDPRNTLLGKTIRRFELDELPQLWQIVAGQFSLVGIRAVAQTNLDRLKREKPKNASVWEQAYFESKPSVFSLNSAVNPNRKDDTKRIHYDLLYTRKASLGLDMYIFWRTAERFLTKLKKPRREVCILKEAQL